MKKLTAIFFLIIILALNVFASDGNITDLYYYDERVEPTYNNPINCMETELGGRFVFEEGYCTEFTLRTGPTWGLNTNTLDVCFYEWNGSYSATVDSEPIESYSIVNHIDNDSYIVPLEIPLAPGEYLWRFENAKADNGHIGLWLDYDCDGIETFFNGERVDGDFHVKLLLDMSPASTRPADTYDGTTILPYVSVEPYEPGRTYEQKMNLLQYLFAGGQFTLGTVTTVMLIISAVFILTAVVLYLVNLLNKGKN